MRKEAGKYDKYIRSIWQHFSLIFCILCIEKQIKFLANHWKTMLNQFKVKKNLKCLLIHVEIFNWQEWKQN